MPSRPSTTGSTDVLMPIQPLHMGRIAARQKTHEFRGYLLPRGVKRIWFYTTAPAQKLRYVADIGNGKKPGEIATTDTGLGNKEFNEGKKKAGTYGYEILKLWEVGKGTNGFTLERLKEEGWIKGPPQKYQYVKAEMLRALAGDGLKSVF
ncbi:hypothetical protein FN846DRAFT_781877 [Sphaerosporella brunnea]|uniref:PUA-like domain-containing protein n=1 Tax=Sphaerosporella brunnea TaxID=1250544 RepID=A0A5J5ERG6_9PEZI|nr:hypothetical protein FN846DRAFT_781877 [Sphaerosporella brunnea]